MKITIGKKSLVKLGVWSSAILAVVVLGFFVTSYVIPALAGAAGTVNGPLFFANSTSIASGTVYNLTRNYGFQVNITNETAQDGGDTYYQAASIRNVTFELCRPTGECLNFTQYNTSGFTTFANTTVAAAVGLGVNFSTYYINLTNEQMGKSGRYVDIVGNYNFTWYANSSSATGVTANVERVNKTQTILYTIASDSTSPIILNITPLNGTYLYGTSTQLFKVNVTEQNLNTTDRNVTLHYRRCPSPSSCAGWLDNNITMKCYADPNAPNWVCNTTIDLTESVSFSDTNMVQFFYNTTDVAGNTAFNGTEGNPLNITIDRTAARWSNQATNDTDNVIARNDTSLNSIKLSVYWTDTYLLSGAILETNETGGSASPNRNKTDMTLSGTTMWSNFSWSNSTVAPGTTVAWRIYANDSVGNQNVSNIWNFTIDGNAPRWNETTNETNVTTGTKYVKGAGYIFNVSIYDNVGVSTVFFEWQNATALANFTADRISGNAIQGNYSIILSDLGANETGYLYRWFMNDSSDNWNVSQYVAYIVNKAATNITLTLNGTRGNIIVNKTEVVNVTAALNVTDKILNISRNGTTQYNGSTPLTYNMSTSSLTTDTTNYSVYNITANFTADANYSTTYEWWLLTIYDRNPYWQSNVTSVPNSVDYVQGTTYYFNVSVSDNHEISMVFLEWQNDSAIYNYSATRYNGSATNGYWNVTLYDLAANETGYLYRWFMNDSSDNWNVSQYVAYRVMKGDTNITLWLNNTWSNVTYNVGNVYNFTAKLNVSGKTIKLNVSDYTPIWKENSTTTPLENISTLTSTPGKYNITAYFPADANYSGSKETWYATIFSWANTTTTLNVTWINSNTRSWLNATCKVRDANRTVNLEGYNVSIYNESTLLTSLRTDAAGNAYYYFQPAVEGQQKINCTIFENTTSFFNVSANSSVTFTTDFTSPVLRNPTPTNNTYIQGSASELFKINVTETNLNETMNAGVSYRIRPATTWTYNKTLTCWQNPSAPNWVCNTTVDLTIAAPGEVIEYWFNATDNATNIGYNGTGLGTNYLNVTVGSQAPRWWNLGVNDTDNVTGRFDGINLTVLWTDDYSLSYVILETNETGFDENKSTYNSVMAMSGTTFWTNFSWRNSSVPLGKVISWRVYANDTSGRWNVSNNYTFSIDNQAPRFWSNFTVNTSSYNSTFINTFNVTWTDNVGMTNNSYCIGCNASMIEINWTGSMVNYTMTSFSDGKYGYEIILGAGTYMWKVHGNDTSGNMNVSDIIWNVTIAKAATNITLTLNGTRAPITVNASMIVNITAAMNVSDKWINISTNNTFRYNGSTPLTYNLTITTSFNNLADDSNITVINVTANWTGDANYSSTFEWWNLTVNDTNPWWEMGSNVTSMPTTSHYVKGATYYFNITVLDNYLVDTVLLEWQNDSAIYNYTATRWNGSAEKGAYNVTLRDLPVNTTGYTYRWFMNDTTNNWNKTVPVLYIVNKAVTNISLTLNGTRAPITVERGQVVNVIAALNISEQWINISRNDTFQYNGSTPLTFNMSTNISLAVHNITANWTGDANYSSTFEWWNLTVQDTTKPTIVGESVSNSVPHRWEIITFNASISDNNEVNQSWVKVGYANSTYIAVNLSMTNSSMYAWGAQYNTSNDTLGVNNFTIFANDTSGNQNRSTTTVNYTLWGWANVSNMLLAGSVNEGTEATAYCLIRDSNVSSLINNYPVSFYMNDTLLETNYTNSSGWAEYDFTINTPNIYRIKCNITDNTTLYYNDSEYQALTKNITVNDITAPVLRIYDYSNATIKKNGNTLTLNISVNDTDAALTLSTAYSGFMRISTFNCTVNISTSFAGNISNTSTWCNGTVTIPSDLGADGNKTINVSVIDISSNTGSNVSYVVQLDNTGPTVAITQPVTNTWVRQGGSLTINATVTDSGVNVADGVLCNASITSINTVYLPAIYYSSATGKCSGVVTIPTIPILTEGTGKTLRVNTSDALWNNGTDTEDIGIDNTAPIITIITPANHTSWINSSTFTLKVNISDTGSGVTSATVCTIKFNATNIGTIPYNATSGQCSGTVTIPSDTSQGNGFVYAYISDDVGNEGMGTINVTYTLSDSTPPVVQKVGPTGTVTTSSTTIWAFTDESATCKYDIGDYAFANMTNEMTTSGMNHTASVSSYANNRYAYYYVRCNDTVGNKMTASSIINFYVNVTSDTTAPTITVTTPTNMTNSSTSTPTITFIIGDELAGTGLNPSTIQASGVSGFSTNVHCSPLSSGILNTTCSFVAGALTDGSNYTINISATDVAGNAAANASLTIGYTSTTSLTASLTSSDTSGVADGDYANGWSFTFNITTGANGNVVRFKMSNWTMTTDSTKIIGVPGNVYMQYRNSTGSLVYYNVTNSYNESQTITQLQDISTATGTQGNVTVYMRIPTGTNAGIYSTTYAFGLYNVTASGG